jgi:hypothetical protein
MREERNCDGLTQIKPKTCVAVQFEPETGTDDSSSFFIKI